MSKFLTTRYGIPVCPICGELAVLHSYRVTDTGIERRKRLCNKGHAFCTKKVFGDEKLVGDIIHLPTLVKITKKTKELKKEY